MNMVIIDIILNSEIIIFFSYILYKYIRKMELEQEKFIINQLTTHSSCKIADKHTDKIMKISTPAVRNILKKDNANGADMKAILCMFDTIFLSASKERTDGLPKLNKNINRLITNMHKLNVHSVEGDVYFTDFLSDDIDVVIKVPKSKKAYTGIIREYFLGISSINKLRYYVPNYTYTLGAFICNMPNNGRLCDIKGKKSAYVLYEKIDGHTLSKLIPELSFEEWLIIFVQLLLALEVGQREIRFTHFDLHDQNVIVKRTQKYQYMVPIENETYYLSNIDFMPIILDYGMSSAYVKPYSIGKYGMSSFGIYNFMVPGIDMYKIMLYSLREAGSMKIAKDISDLFEFYGKDDPYKIFSYPNAYYCAVNNYCANISSSPVANLTPIMLLRWIWNKHNNILKKYINIGQRNDYCIIKYSNTLKEYDYIFNNAIQGRNKAIKLINQCITSKHSYIMSVYNVKILEEYNKSLDSNDINSHIKQIKLTISNDYENLIKLDMTRLEKIFEIKIPNQSDFDVSVKKVLEITIEWKIANDKISVIRDFNSKGEWYIKLEPFMQIYYTMREIKLLDIFSDWYDRFLDSEIYKFYVKNCSKYIQTRRWCDTLLGSINM